MKLSDVAALLLATSLPLAARADNARFDLAGPKIDVRVTRGTTTLPIAQVPNLQPGDKIWVKADLPKSQSNHLLLIVAFLRGTTNEPPDDWFTKIDTWDKASVEGTTITVPAEAQQAVLFVAPETGGDFKTLRSAVKGRPGLFIRSDADLNEASFEQQRIERYLAAMKTVPQDDPKAIQDRSAKLADTLALKPNADCFKQPVDAQVNCLTQSSAPLLLDDGHGQGIAEALSSGASSDFINAASYTQPVGGGAYSAYVGAIVDLVHLTSQLRTAQYQYIPAISFPEGSTLNLKLNAPPSFHNPKTVIVIGLPAIQQAKLPPLRPHDPNQVACLLQPRMTLALEGAPLVFSTGFAHDLVLHLNRTGAPTDLQVTPDAFEGGLVLAKTDGREPLHDASPAQVPTTAVPAKSNATIGSSTDPTITGTVHGYWGFDAFDGPSLTLQQVAGKSWKIIGNAQLMAGQENHLTLDGDGTACVQHIALTNNKDKDLDVSYKPAKAEGDKGAKAAAMPLDLDVSLKQVQPGGYSLAIQQFGDANKSNVPLTAYTGDIHLDALTIHAGDNTATLAGEKLGDVVSVEIAKEIFSPKGDGGDGKTLQLEGKTGVSPENGSEASVKLKDGRTVPVKIAMEAPRPGLKLLSFESRPAQANDALLVVLGSKEDIPLNGKVTFVVQTKDAFPRSQTIEVAVADGSVKTVLSLADNNLVLQDEHTAVATLEPLKAFGNSAFGALKMRPVAQDGTPGNWTPLGNLVRTPEITAIHCTTADAPTCTLDGSQLFLVQRFGASNDFGKGADVPTGFADNSFFVPTPADGATLYLKLRDDPNSVATVKLATALPKPAPPPASAAQANPPALAPTAPAPGPTPQAAAPPPAPAPVPAAAKPASPVEAPAATPPPSSPNR